MGLQYDYFVAADDAAAIAAFSAPGGIPAPSLFTEEVRFDDLGEIEHILTGRAIAEIVADPRHAADLADRADEDTGLWEVSLSTVTDTFARALAEADLSTLPEACRDVAPALRDLVPIARHGVARGHHMYCVWGE